MNLSYITLYVEDVQRTKAWYVTTLELAVISDRGDAVLLGGPQGAALELRKGKPLDHPERVRLGFNVADVSTVFKRMNDRKVPLPGGLKKTERGHLAMTLKDPAGHTVEIFQVQTEELQRELSLPQSRP